jgi:hypothetical protein
MTIQSYSTTFSVDQTPRQVFDAVLNVRGWWSGNIEGRMREAGDEFSYRYRDIHYSKQRLVEIVPDSKVVWLVLESHLSFAEDKSEWNGTKLMFEIAPKGDRTELRFTHQGLVPDHECFDKCSGAWGFYINDSLKSLITTGKGDPNRGEG